MTQRLLLMVIVSAFLLTSCSEGENLSRDVFGMWQLTEMWNGDEVERHDDIFYGFQNKIIQIQQARRDITNNSVIYRGKYNCKGDSLMFALLDPVGEVSPVFRIESHIGSEHVNRFRVQELSESRMVWTRGEHECFIFRRY